MISPAMLQAIEGRPFRGWSVSPLLDAGSWCLLTSDDGWRVVVSPDVAPRAAEVFGCEASP